MLMLPTKSGHRVKCTFHSIIFIIDWAFVIIGGVPTDAVVEQLDVLEDTGIGLPFSLEILSMNRFNLESCKEGFHQLLNGHETNSPAAPIKLKNAATSLTFGERSLLELLSNLACLWLIGRRFDCLFELQSHP